MVVSASRRTDIPQFYARWFAERRRQGEAVFRTAFGTPGRASLRREDVLGYLFWTKYAGPFHEELAALRDEGVPHAFQYTVTGYGREVERGIPALAVVLEDVLAVRAGLPAAACLEWRYDPIVLGGERTPGWHLRRFASIAAELRGATEVVNVSVIEPYARTVRRMTETGDVLYRPGEAARNRGVPAAGAEATALLVELRDAAAERAMELRVCANPEWGHLPSQCVSPRLFAPWGAAAAGLGAVPVRPSRPGCRCLAVVDIGMDNTCLGGCRYCYVTVSDAAAARHRARHDPLAPSLR